MRLEDVLKESGYEAAKAQVDGWVEARDGLRSRLLLASVAESREIAAHIAELDDAISQAQPLLEREYAAHVDMVDARNDVDFEMESLKETARLAIEYFATIDPAKAAELSTLFPDDE